MRKGRAKSNGMHRKLTALDAQTWHALKSGKRADIAEATCPILVALVYENAAHLPATAPGIDYQGSG
jgi:hypothetical protein